MIRQATLPSSRNPWLALALTCLLWSPPLGAAPAPACVEFRGLQHCTLGSATLTLTEVGLELEGLDASGDSGKIALFEATDSWSAAYDVKEEGDYGDEGEENDGGGAALTVDFLSSGEAIGTGRIEDDGDGAVFSAGYTGGGESGSVSVLIFDHGVFVGGLGGIPGGSPAARSAGGALPSLIKEIRDEFYIAPAGNCELTWLFDEAQSFELPDGSILDGDEIRLVEEVAAGGRYPYLSFDAVAVRANFGSLVLTAEGVGSPL